jgi:signal transduction histidine kinase
MIYAGILFFIYAFIDGRSISFKQKMIVFSLLLPTVVLTSTNLNLSVYDLTNCWREAIEGPLPYYSYFIEIIFVLWILGFGIKRFFQFKDSAEKKKTIFITMGAVFFLLSFAMGNVVGSLLIDWEIGQYGLFGIPIFIAMLSYLIVKYNAFNVKLISTQALMIAIWLLVLGVFFIRTIENVRAIIALTLILVTIAGDLLINSVKREVEQRERLAELNISLRDLIKQRESLVHLITHKVKGSFTRTKFIFAGLLDGTFGDINPEVRKIAEQGLEFDNGGIQTVDLVLNVANLQNGLIKYEMREVDFKDIVTKTVEEKKLAVEAKGLKIELEIEKDSYEVTGDAFWLKEVVNNLIENSIKYTKEGKITVSLSDGGKILLSVKDTGLGITKEDMQNLFTEGGRGKDSIKTNVDSTGYGLYTVKMVVEAHKGKVWGESEGPGLGSQFYVELPVA